MTALRLGPLFALSLIAACGDGEDAAPANDTMTSAPAAANEAAPATPQPAPAANATAPETMVLTPLGYGTIRIGAKPSEASYGLKDDGSYQDACRIWMSDELPGLAVLVEDGLIRRITLYSGPKGASLIRTDRGIGVGSTEAEVRAAYSPLGEEAHKYAPAPAKNLYWGEEGVPQAFRFEIGEDGKVTELHAGESPWLRYVEGCS